MAHINNFYNMNNFAVLKSISFCSTSLGMNIDFIKLGMNLWKHL